MAAPLAVAASFIVAVSSWLVVPRHLRSAPRRARRVFKRMQLSTKYEREVLVAIEVALRCGQAMKACKRRTPVFKDALAIDPVTATDEENEAYVTRVIAERFPNHEVIGEEASAKLGSIPELTEKTTWIVDPIDGTQNFVHGAPLSVVSIGMCSGAIPVLGVVYDPYRDELFVGVANEGLQFLCPMCLTSSPKVIKEMSGLWACRKKFT
ncbi:hypothetical protein CYMTET_20181 [Cymbomonas tetramitiformis]|uniref:Inositol-phosphate phosphatase n=1 Tax=Cymbomonas tetramitiformis TaxID=36881 RepID=A0AAE0L456_9CHLO|nr:hypothetical protein CYMTET_20181 [Cymbomonas tetramitiformis]